jgi:predicted RNase H-like HicB family nuclease
MNLKKYTIIIEKGQNSYGAYVPDIPGLVTVSKSKDVTLDLCRQAIKEHIETLQNDGKPLPEARSESESIELEY